VDVNRQKWFEKKWEGLSAAQQGALRRVLEGKGSTVDGKILSILSNRLLIERRLAGTKFHWYVPEHVKRCMENLSPEN